MPPAVGQILSYVYLLYWHHAAANSSSTYDNKYNGKFDRFAPITACMPKFDYALKLTSDDSDYTVGRLSVMIGEALKANGYVLKLADQASARYPVVSTNYV